MLRLAGELLNAPLSSSFVPQGGVRARPSMGSRGDADDNAMAESLFSTLQCADTGMGFVLIQHLDPLHESALALLLARSTAMPVYEVTQNMRVEPNTVYVIPPNVQMAIVGGVLKLTPRGKVHGAARSIDFFFEALARDQRERAIGVVLSGTASDGTLGLEAIKAEGGLTFAQDDSAKYDSMPRSAIAAGCVDAVMSLPELAAELTRIAKHPYVMNAVTAYAVHAPAVTNSASVEGTLIGGAGLTAIAPDMYAEAERDADHGESPDAPLASGEHGTPHAGTTGWRASTVRWRL